MNVTAIDRNPLHLWPAFRAALDRLLRALEARTGEPWCVEEGLRSPARQSWLYAQGRTRPGPVVTWMRTPKWHGTGLAADVRPRRGYACPPAWWQLKHQLEPRFGLHNPPFVKGDLGHVQLNCGMDVVLAARRWVAAGCPDTLVEPALPPLVVPAEAPARLQVALVVNGRPYPAGDAYLESGRTWGWVRPLLDDLSLSIVSIDNGGAVHLARGGVDHRYPLRVEGGRGYIPLAVLGGRVTGFPGVSVRWEPSSHTVRIDAAPLPPRAI